MVEGEFLGNGYGHPVGQSHEQERGNIWFLVFFIENVLLTGRSQLCEYCCKKTLEQHQ